MIAKHDSDIKKMTEDLDRQLPVKVKESSELLNLRKMEEHMAKQKKYYFFDSLVTWKLIEFKQR